MSDSPTRSGPPADAPTLPPRPAPDATHDLHEPTVASGATGAAIPVAPPGYELLEEVGAGGMGVVYRAREIAFDRDVAVKFLQDRFPADSPSARRFLDEARITGQLQHSAIPPVHHIGTLPDGRPFLAMKLIKGETLAALLEAEPGNRGRFVAVFAQVCQAVGYAHSRQVIHRDLKPANVMVGAFGEVQVMDWGLAKVLTSEGNQPSEPTEAVDSRTEIRTTRDADSATQAGSILGTPAYMSPEQAGGEVGKVDERSDVFGLGAILCVILTGKPPYWGPNTDSVRLRALLGETADALARLDASGADPELVALAKRCLATNRDERPRDAGEVAKAVTAHLAAAEERARQAELDRVRAEEQRKRRRVQFALAGAVLLLLALAAFGAGLHSLWRDAESAREVAEGAKKDAESARDQLAGEKRLTEDARDEAIRQRGIAERAQASEEMTRKNLEVFEYGLRMQLAHQGCRDGNIAVALALLDSTRPDLRGWEWHYVHRLCHSDLLTLGHTSVVSSASFNPDGSRIVTGSDDKTARVWDATTGKELFPLTGHTASVRSASFSPDGSRIVTAASDKTARVWDAKTGDPLITLKGHTASVTSAVFSADGSRIVTGSGDNTAKVWDAKSGAPVLTLKGHTHSVTSASWSADGSRILTASGDKTVRVWDARPVNYDFLPRELAPPPREVKRP